MSCINNPFVTSGYMSVAYFCDRQKETREFLQKLMNGRNISLLSYGGMGKTAFMEHCFQQLPVPTNYYIFKLDIRTTKSLREFVYLLGKTILETLRPYGRKVTQLFADTLVSIRYELEFDTSLVASWATIDLGDIKSPKATLKEIFKFLSIAGKTCIVAIDNYHYMSMYPEEDVIETVGKMMRKCKNARFVLAGSRRYKNGELYPEALESFYERFLIVNLKPIEMETYNSFACKHFEAAGKELMPEVVESLYERFDGIISYNQKVLNVLFDLTPEGGICSVDVIDQAIRIIIDSNSSLYSSLIYQLTERQKELFISICKEEKVSNVRSSSFAMTHSLQTPGSIYVCTSSLLERDYITKWKNRFFVASDRFFSLWVKQNL